MTSNAQSQELNLIDLLNERHRMIQKIYEKKWNDISNIHISSSEWRIMAEIYEQRPTIAYITKNVDISRQAIHKIIKNLSTKGLVEIQQTEKNKKEKCIELTAYGEECYKTYIRLKAQLEEKIEEKLGVEQIMMIKDILRLDWGIERQID